MSGTKNQLTKTIMKRLIFLIAILVVSCSKTPQEISVQFHTNLVESGSLTRSADHDEILSLIESTYPAIRPQLWYGDYGGENIYITLNTPTNVKVGNWLCTYSAPNTMTYAETMSQAGFRLSPHMYLEQYVNIVPSVKDYTLEMHFGSCAFLWDSREVTKVMFNGRNENLPSQKVTFGVSGEHYTCVFLTGSYTGDGDILIFQVHPLDETGEVTRFYFSNVYDEWQGNPCHKIENGHYYVLHPTFITEIEDGQFSISFPDWICSME